MAEMAAWAVIGVVVVRAAEGTAVGIGGMGVSAGAVGAVGEGGAGRAVGGMVVSVGRSVAVGSTGVRDVSAPAAWRGERLLKPDAVLSQVEDC